MGAALLAIPRALYAAACSEDEVAYARFIEIQAMMRARAVNKQPPVGVSQFDRHPHPATRPTWPV